MTMTWTRPIDIASLRTDTRGQVQLRSLPASTNALRSPVTSTHLSITEKCFVTTSVAKLKLPTCGGVQARW